MKCLPAPTATSNLGALTMARIVTDHPLSKTILHNARDYIIGSHPAQDQ
jgi:hypothetical protein